ncbi:MAG: helix-turn-helix domain-containing protein [Solirubrobacterales bacterium]
MPPHPANADPALGAAIRRLREDRGLSMEALAYKAGVTLNTITRLELAQSEPGWMTVRKVTDALGVSLAELAAAVESER